MVLGHARGVILLAAEEAGVPIAEYSPAEVKSAVTGNGRAGKDQVGRMVRMLLPGSGELPADTSDALAVALCFAARRPLARALAAR